MPGPRGVVAFVAACAVALLAGCAAPHTSGGAVGHPACTVRATGQDDFDHAGPGDVVCLAHDFTRRLAITSSGTAGRPITYLGDGHRVGRGIDVAADHVVVAGFTMAGPEAPGVWLQGDHDTLRDTRITNPRGGDGDGIRFFGDDMRILRNVVHGTDDSTGAHADCMQTYQSDTPASRHVLIEGNRCERIDNMSLMAEGPNDGEGDGGGTSSGFTIRHNYYQTLEASQEVMIEDVQHCVIEDNTFAGSVDHAIGLAIHSTGARVAGNRVSPGIGYAVGIDDSSRPGYAGPEPGGPRRPPDM